MRENLAHLLLGILFGAGLAVSGMINPAKVLGFLDIAGNWDPTLAFVMAGALAVTVPGYRLVRRLQGPVLGGTFDVPARSSVDARLIGGAALFGLGWGLVGFCPGPSVAALSSGSGRAVLFFLAMLAGMLLYRRLGERIAAMSQT